MNFPQLTLLQERWFRSLLSQHCGSEGRCEAPGYLEGFQRGAPREPSQCLLKGGGSSIWLAQSVEHETLKKGRFPAVNSYSENALSILSSTGPTCHPVSPWVGRMGEA